MRSGSAGAQYRAADRAAAWPALSGLETNRDAGAGASSAMPFAKA